jgi:phospholipid/cholesterol/gamma-HCH transport system ATP-binding protein
MLSVDEISVRFGSHQVLDRASFVLQEGQIAGLIGPSGGGKSVLMKVLAGVQEPSSGRVDIHDRDLDDVSLMFQEGALFDSLTVFDNVAFPLVSGRVPTDSFSAEEIEPVRIKVQEILSRVGLVKAANKYPAQLSGGMRRRVSLARAVVARPSLLLLDDPTCGLDPVASSVIMELISELHREYRPTMVLVSHDLRRLFPIVNTIFALFDGQVQFSGDLVTLATTAPESIQRFVSCRYDLGSVIGDGKQEALSSDSL